MTNICAIVGTKCNKSNTAYFTKKLLAHLKEKLNTDININIYNLHDFKIEYCNGCLTCRKEGNCPVKDDMKFLKTEMIKSDIIVLASPVYIHNISGIMKTFLDRLCIWNHTMRLAGKKGIILTTTSSSGDIQVRNYLKNILLHMGAVSIGDFNICVDFPQELYIESKENFIIENAVSKIIEKIKNNDMTSSLIQEVIFNNLKKVINRGIENNYTKNYEIFFWENNGLVNYNSFKELTNDILQNGKELK
ncbi:MAG: NAD(P)H-dependent oxidoreductase [Terrisporobacter sp.]|uniref:flavodoxin family protein n=1 Tax=Terrisporobacter sp. TaxID=1965305 RepID=UPI002FC71947